MKPKFAVAIYQRFTDLVVVPENGGDGPYFAVEPIECVPMNVEALAPAIERAVDVSDVSLGPVDLRQYKSPIPKALRLRSNSEFESSVREVCSVVARRANITIELSRRARDLRGFEPTGRMLTVATGATARQLAEAALQLLREPNAPAV